MSKQETITRNSYSTKNTGNFSDRIELNGISYQKVEDLRYGTNPHQTAAYYKPVGISSPLGDMEILKSGKNGLSQTNLEDISYSLNIVKFFDVPACAVMKHVNPSGAAVSINNEKAKDVYIKARDCDPRAAFGSVIGFNCNIDADAAEEIMNSFAECVAAPSFTDDAVKVFNDSKRFKVNASIRIIKCGSISALPKFVGESKSYHKTIKILTDGSFVIADPLLTNIKSINDIRPAAAENSKTGKVKSEITPTKDQLNDLLAAWYVNINVRSNGVVIFKNGQTLSVGTGEQDRVGVTEQAIMKYHQKYHGKENIENVEIAAKAGIKAIIAPAGSLKDAEVIIRANELKIAIMHAPERIFSHH
jgi:phosphoribosylaminoimidazolecarboxamide formyltransferase/IMP cyclohydrolase